jgi:ligand-binding SRPBCC domain-containing protein
MRRESGIMTYMHVYTLERETLSPLPLEETFAFFEDPQNLARITPPWLAFRIATADRVQIRRGARITYTISWMRVPLKWETVITGYDPPHSFVDTQVRGPYRLWRHLHTFVNTPEGTRVRDCVDYALPFGWLGRAAHILVVRKQLNDIFDFRQRTLAEILGAATAK